MNELDRMRKLAGILTEGVMPVPGVGQQAATPGIDEMFGDVEEKAPPGMEDVVMNLKKEYPGEPEKAFATAWSIYNKKHGKTEESGMEEDVAIAEGNIDLEIQSAIEMLQELENNGMEPEAIVSAIEQSFRDDGFSDKDIAGVMAAVQQHIEGGEGSEEDDGECPTCHGTGEGMYDGASCSNCGGSGQLSGSDPDDFDEPDDYNDDDGFYGSLEEEVPMQSKLDDALDALIQTMNSGAGDAESEAQWVAKTHNVDPRALAHAYAQYKAEELGRGGMMEEVEEVEEAFDLNNGYDDIQFMAPGDFFPDGADSPVISQTGPSGAKQGDNPEQKKMAVAETHKELVYNYRKFLKESAKK